MKIGLVLEGGGMRGLYTAGVLDTMMAENWQPHYVVGVSAGACHAASFVSGQRGRAYRTNMDYLGDSRYLSFRNYLKTGSLFGMKFIFETVPDHLDPYDYEAMLASPIDYEIGVTDVDTGKGVFYSKEALYHDCTLLSASSSIPVFSPIVEYQGHRFLDGGVAAPIPVERALEKGCDFIVAVLTRDRQYVKKPESFRHVYQRVFRKYPHMMQALDNRHKVYGKSRELLFQLEKEGKALVIAPETPVLLSRFEKDRDKLNALYVQGQQECRRLVDAGKLPPSAGKQQEG